MSISIRHDPKTRETTAKCLLCDVSLQLAEIANHRTSEQHRTASRDQSGNGAWRCNVCDITMNLTFKDSHLQGKKHRARVAFVAFCNGGNGPPRVSIESTLAVKDDPELLAEMHRIHLMNIDTQWGLLPGGGAYGDSDYYAYDSDEDVWSNLATRY
ncbi:hypothetical protein VNI00_006255 [Paramarasmius palmivorus]|uniref:U1-type domain-containing protein n=1 Tax=Paramarasmius palmivorus TaxID=297713 RepID=A0AAW0D8M0_9AGAR